MTLTPTCRAPCTPAGRHWPAQLRKKGIVHVAPRYPDESGHQRGCGGREAMTVEQFGIDAMLQQLAVDQHTVAIEDQQRHAGSLRPRADSASECGRCPGSGRAAGPRASTNWRW